VETGAGVLLGVGGVTEGGFGEGAVVVISFAEFVEIHSGGGSEHTPKFAILDILLMKHPIAKASAGRSASREFIVG